MRKLNFVLGIGCILSLFIGMTFSSCSKDDPDVYYYESGNTYEVGGGHLSDKGAATHYYRHR